MSITLADLRRNLRTIPINYNGLEFTVNYRPAVITPTFGASNDQDFLVSALVQLLDSWDVYADEAHTERVPLTAELLSSEGVGLPLLRIMFDAIMDDALVGGLRGAISVAG